MKTPLLRAGKTGWALKIGQFQREQGLTISELTNNAVCFNLQLGFSLREMNPSLSQSEVLVHNTLFNR